MLNIAQLKSLNIESNSGWKFQEIGTKNKAFLNFFIDTRFVMNDGLHTKTLFYICIYGTVHKLLLSIFEICNFYK